MIKILLESLTTKYFQFSGRASRKEYWILCLFTFFIMYLLVFLKPYPLVMFAIFLISCVPYISLSTRRLHDLNFSGFWELLILIIVYLILYTKLMFLTDFISFFYCIVLGLIKGTPSANKYGDPPTD